MRVLHLDSQRGWRGGEYQAELLIRGLGHQTVEVAAVGRADSPWLARCQALAIPHFANRLRPGPVALWNLTRILRQFRPDVIHCHDAGSILPAALAARAAGPVGALRPGGRPMVVAARRVDFPIRSRFKYTRLCDRIISVSQAVTDVLTHQGLPAERVRTVLDGIDPARFRDRLNPAAARANLDLPPPGPDAIVGLCVAALTDHKDHATLLNAWRLVVNRHPGALLLLAGRGEQEAALKAQCAALNLDRQVRFLGWREDIPDLLAAADIFLLTSHHEGLGSTLMDAQFCGLPVVATRAGGIPEVVADGATGLLATVRAPEAVAQAALRLIDCPALRRELGQAGQLRAQTEFVYERMVRQTLAVYGELLAAPRVPAAASMQPAWQTGAGELCAIQIDRADSLQK